MPDGAGGFVANVDPMIPKHEPGHPIAHRFAVNIPTSQCIVCHIHPGTNVLNEYLGFMWWDNETDGDLMYPREQRHPTAEELTHSQMSNPEDAAARGRWGEPEFLARVPELNQVTRHSQFADFHGHGWVFRAVFKKDRQGHLLGPRWRRCPAGEHRQALSGRRAAGRALSARTTGQPAVADAGRVQKARRFTRCI